MAAHDPLLQQLFAGDTSGFASASNADFVLVLKLFHWTGENVALTRQLLRAMGGHHIFDTTGESSYQVDG